MQLHEYQKVARNFLLHRLYDRSGSGLWLDCGLGKTAVTLHTIKTLQELGEIKTTLIIAPLRVIAISWPSEIAKWGFDFNVSTIHGTRAERLTAANAKADLYLTNCENVPWLEQKTRFKTDLLIVDEATKFKNWSAKRTKSLRRMLLRIPKRVTLTGTPVPNSLADIFSQQFILDTGETLGTALTHFRNRYMERYGFESRQWRMRDEMIEPLQELVAPWYLHQAAVDHLDMPKLVKNEILVDLPPGAKNVYKQMQREMFAELEDGKTLTVLSGGGKYNICRQIASGGAYDENHIGLGVHDAKLDALEDVFDELNGKSLLVAYCFNHELMRIQKRFPKAVAINGGTKAAECVEIMAAWKAKKINMLVVQCQAMSHGVDGLQDACNDVCWFSLTDQPEIRHQLECRIYRQGVVGQVRVHYLMARGTVDLAIKRTLDNKDATQSDVLDAIKKKGNE